MRVLAVDQATTSGFAFGTDRQAERWVFGSFKMPKRDDPGERLVYFRDRISELIETHKPDILAREEPYMPVGAHNAKKDGKAPAMPFSPKTISFLKWTEGVLLEVGARYGLVATSYPSQTWRVTALGMGRAPAGAAEGELKRMMVRRAKALGYDVQDDNQGDAIGILMHELMGSPAAARAQGDLLERELREL